MLPMGKTSRGFSSAFPVELFYAFPPLIFDEFSSASRWHCRMHNILLLLLQYDEWYIRCDIR
jgi:hypothetical protein